MLIDLHLRRRGARTVLPGLTRLKIVGHIGPHPVTQFMKPDYILALAIHPTFIEDAQCVSSEGVCGGNLPSLSESINFYDQTVPRQVIAPRWGLAVP